MAILKTLRTVLTVALLATSASASAFDHHHHSHEHDIEIRDSSDLEARTVSEKPAFAYNVLWSLHKTFWDNFIYPANVKQAQSINSTLLAPNVIGRVDITRVFTGQELNTDSSEDDLIHVKTSQARHRPDETLSSQSSSCETSEEPHRGWWSKAKDTVTGRPVMRGRQCSVDAAYDSCIVPKRAFLHAFSTGV